MRSPRAGVANRDRDATRAHIACCNAGSSPSVSHHRLPCIPVVILGTLQIVASAICRSVLAQEQTPLVPRKATRVGRLDEDTRKPQTRRERSVGATLGGPARNMGYAGKAANIRGSSDVLPLGGILRHGRRGVSDRAADAHTLLSESLDGAGCLSRLHDRPIKRSAWQQSRRALACRSSAQRGCHV
jgi:hypothetical protein